ncbi:hypothetical protein C4M98_00240 [Mycoplasmopsis pullorum]|uniref:Nif3-like dinuclear metal center hexameric protein n=3 Tax=Mycoplasmopsis pullorum TaxID=48003 RepID=UPI001117DE2E|nr:Nif3-like dinuclear metal center hexameric protein [Mycoplasmopsis pullorum]TNK82311.1 hypothetical protein C4M80_03190 [Mycoplasmopsis pullorum]TNK86636.1 hypothetical protein C4M82_02665 [Mycoplasmopsis pullorum]TNK87520.1 hypothetical protein C4M87_01985 [Mycoplasmopsis pullorum]TNK88541.1 hypothetical protein C4M97_03185 [Mycoplasmopsis pullorum]TNK99503.1 hypothetical protein C4M98_00240 [Mycoplasmopsis pullorum]
MQIKKITDYLLNKYPLSNAEIWDPTGWAIKFRLSEKLTGVMIAIDLTKEVLEKAIELNCNLIITHHPFLFEKTRELELLKAPYKKEMIQIIREKRINVIGFHTNYDNDAYGTSYQIARYLGMENNVTYKDFGYPVSVSYNIKFNDLIQKLKTDLLLSDFRTNVSDLEMNLSRIGILSGSGYITEVNNFSRLNYDLIITSDIKWSDWINYDQIGAKVLEVPHLDEQVFVWDVYEQLRSKFPEINLNFMNLAVPYKNIS